MLRINFTAQCVTSRETLVEQRKSSEGRPRIETMPLNGRRLAVVGSGPSIKGHLEELRNWEGDIWAINYTGEWLRSQGIESTFVTIDSQPFDLTRISGAAILPSCCHPSMYDAFDSVRIFDSIDTDEVGITGGTTTATRMPHLAVTLGYGDVTFFGCEGSFDAADHVYGHTGVETTLVIRAGGKDYGTENEWLMQSENLAEILMAWPDIFKEKSGGLLRAVMENKDTWEIVAVSASMKARLEAHNGYTPYQWPFELKAA